MERNDAHNRGARKLRPVFLNLLNRGAGFVVVDDRLARIRVPFNDWLAANFAGNAFDEGTIASIHFNAPASIVQHSLKKGTGVYPLVASVYVPDFRRKRGRC
jgi:hypothetical protein